ncbi:MAG: hypothetical protein PHV36_13010 [Elusimicrobiales bacterium]|nr:hypothetical protein [Elusimicrobiales bacterium]
MLLNIFKDEYCVQRGESLYVIGATSCHELSVPTYKLLSKLPAKAGEPEYLAELGRLGAAEPERILGKLMGSGCLVPALPWYSRQKLLRSILTPSIGLISGRVQHKLLSFLKAGAYSEAALFRFTAAASVAGLLSALPLLFFDWRAAGSASPGGMLLPAIILLSILVHELGHSSLAHLNGIGFRPIGFAVYLVYPVFYTNVSGVGELPLKRRLSVNLGGLAFQSVFAFLLFLAYAASREKILLAAVFYILYLLLFNLNPLISTDGYWCWKDVTDAYRDDRRLKYFRKAYDALSVLFSGYLLYVAYLLLTTVLGYLRLFGLQRAVPGWQALANAYVFLLLLKGVSGRLKLYFPRRDLSPVEHPFILPPGT